MPRRALVWIGLAMWAAWAAAASAQPAAPIEYRGLPSAPASVPPPPEAPPPSAPHSSPAPEAPQAGWEGPGTPLSAYALRPEEAHPYDPARLPQSHRVQPGQTIYDIATLYQIPLRALIDQNCLSAPFALHVGQVLRLPPPRFYTIAAGDTLESVARQFNVDAR
ncbi:MAG: LysM peptidoglycan-binding domain-containing protein, partial [Hyphomonadaceae bacterium]